MAIREPNLYSILIISVYSLLLLEILGKYMFQISLGDWDHTEDWQLS